MSTPPPAKRPCLTQGLPRASHSPRLVSKTVLRLSRQINNYLNVDELMKYATIPELDFLSDDERDHIWKCYYQNRPCTFLASTIMKFLSSRKGAKREDDFRKFVACVNQASEHRGHKELSKMFRAKLGKEEWLLIQKIEEDSETPLPSPYTTPQNSPAHRVIIYSPERPLTLISLEGTLTEIDFLNTERELWLSFSRGNYDDLGHLLKTVQEDQCKHPDPDSQVVAMWFQSLIMMHHHVNYEDAICMLDDALKLTSSCVNETILLGRIYQRKAQIFLMQGEKTLGAEHFKMAKEQLQFVGRGYDKANMYCREAKMLSATEPNRRDDIEKVYQDALGTLEQDDSYFLASYPSVTLSKAAFHLHIAFGSKLTPNDQLPTVSSDDIKKARETLSNFNEEEHILIDMRRFEYDLIQAELCRLEGRDKESRHKFTAVMKNKVGNIASIAEHRMRWIKGR